ESSCASCHSGHGTDLKIVRDPNVCATCHMGPDHPQWEAWQTSKHGTLHESAGPDVGPSCQTCHMPKGTHDVSGGITLSSGGDPLPLDQKAPRRAEMQARCEACHAPAFARKALERDDAVQAESQALVKEAEAIIADLADHGLLDPMPDQRPPHPLRGHALVLDNQMLFEDTSHIERLFFKMKKYDYAKTVKGAFHANPAYAHWYGNAELKMDLIDIKAEANRLRERKRNPGVASAPESLEARLRALKAKADRGALSPEAYEQEKARLLQEAKADSHP
ncbi:MAG TPA: multiheme c-type cytochrome, partial [Holophagaceae bacterium]|nr:multiheme c-type cytochrome [Holophagaceae bacterium]